VYPIAGRRPIAKSLTERRTHTAVAVFLQYLYVTYPSS
jgi:hypothetical protein